MNEIDAWLACKRDGSQWFIYTANEQAANGDITYGDYGAILCQTSGHDIAPGECRHVKLRVEVVNMTD